MFVFKNKVFNYFDCKWHKVSEKTLELALAYYYLKEAYKKGYKVIEWGNVTRFNQHLFDFQLSHDVVDICEGPTFKEDFEFWEPKHNYDFLLSISTLEHVGTGDNNLPKEGIQKTIKVAKRIPSIAPRALLTIPLQCNTELEDLILNNKEPFDIYNKTYYTRISEKEWEEIPREKVGTLGKKYHYPWKYCNEISILDWNLDF